jgi:uncharacterized membrane protein YphA (DoxX/SURF4 family)
MSAGAVGPILDEAARMAAWSIRLAVAAIFLEAGMHALRERAVFAGVIAAYRMVPAALVPSAALGVPALQIAAAMALMVPRWARPGACLALLLLLAFTVAIAVNLWRGRSDIDCGCGGGAAQTISPALVVRNLVLSAAVACALSAPTKLVFALPAYVGVAGFGVFLTGVYFAASQLLSNALSFAAARDFAA